MAGIYRAAVLVGLAAVLAAPGAAAGPAGDRRSHAPMRPLPAASERPLAAGAGRWVDAGAGDDAAAGTHQAPWRTLGRALGALGPGDTLYLRGGVYYERVEARLRGAAAAPITLRSAPGELAVLDGGLSEFARDPKSAWRPHPEGAAGEYVSTATYPRLGRALGLFADSMVPLHAYREVTDLRAGNELWTANDAPVYCGPGLWWNPVSGRIHARLAPVTLAALPEARRYRGTSDPRRVPLVVGGGDGVALRIEDSRHVRLEDLVLRGGDRAALAIEDSAHVELSRVTLYSGEHALTLAGTAGVRILDSALRGPSAPWSSRASLKYKGNAGVLVATTGLVVKNRDLEIGWSEATDGHDGLFLGDVRGARVHHTLVENFNDDALFFTARGLAGGDVEIYRNRLVRNMTPFAFGYGTGQLNLPGSGVRVYRNVVEQLEPVYYFPPGPNEPLLFDYYGGMGRDHGSPVWEPLAIYHNTFVVRRAERYGYVLGWGTHLAGTRRRLWNNVFVHVEGTPDLAVPDPAADFASDGNLFWSVGRGAELAAGFFTAYSGSAAFAASRARYPPGWEAASRYGDPRFVAFDPGLAGGDYRLRSGSAAVDAGVDLPAALPDPLRALDRGRPDAGALPAGAAPLAVGPRPPPA